MLCWYDHVVISKEVDMNESPPIQTSSFTITMRTLIRNDTHSKHIHERVTQAIRDEFAVETGALLSNTATPTEVLTVESSHIHKGMATADYQHLTSLAPDRARAILIKSYGESLGIVGEYIREAEHQEGDEYWAQFNTGDELHTDFALYLLNSDLPEVGDE